MKIKITKKMSREAKEEADRLTRKNTGTSGDNPYVATLAARVLENAIGEKITLDDFAERVADEWWDDQSDIGTDEEREKDAKDAGEQAKKYFPN